MLLKMITHMKSLVPGEREVREKEREGRRERGREGGK